MVAAAVILHEDFDPTGLRGGKKKSPSSRLAAYQRIRSGAVAIGVAQVSPQEIDLGFHAWHMRLLREPVAALPIEPDFVLVDHYEIPELGLPQKRIAAAGDASVSIAAASIVAKVECDRIMEATDAAYPGYGFLNNKGVPRREGVAAQDRAGERRSVGHPPPFDQASEGLAHEARTTQPRAVALAPRPPQA
jgi:ribonuclease HII